MSGWHGWRMVGVWRDEFEQPWVYSAKPRPWYDRVLLWLLRSDPKEAWEVQRCGFGAVGDRVVSVAQMVPDTEYVIDRGQVAIRQPVPPMVLVDRSRPAN